MERKRKRKRKGEDEVGCIGEYEGVKRMYVGGEGEGRDSLRHMDKAR